MPVQHHTHNGIDSPQLEPAEALEIPFETTAPSHAAPNGTLWVQDDGSSTYRLYIMVNGTWRYATLT